MSAGLGRAVHFWVGTVVRVVGVVFVDVRVVGGVVRVVE